MKINKNFNFNFKKEDFDLNKIKEFTLSFFLNNSGFVFMTFFVLIAVTGSFLIYEYIYNSVWSESEKSAYLQEMKKDNLDFKINVFNDVVAEIKSRELRYLNDEQIKVNDIFGTKK